MTEDEHPLDGAEWPDLDPPTADIVGHCNRLPWPRLSGVRPVAPVMRIAVVEKSAFAPPRKRLTGPNATLSLLKTWSGARTSAPLGPWRCPSFMRRASYRKSGARTVI
jgi:hypothetical protein